MHRDKPPLGPDLRREERDKELKVVGGSLDPGLRRERVNGVHASRVVHR